MRTCRLTSPGVRKLVAIRRIGRRTQPCRCISPDADGLSDEPLDEAKATVRTDLFGGRGSVRIWDLGARTPPFSATLFCELEANGSVGRHQQASEVEQVIVVEGSATITVSGRAQACVRGSAVAVPLGAILAIDNGPAPLRYLLIKAAKSGTGLAE